VTERKPSVDTAAETHARHRVICACTCLQARENGALSFACGYSASEIGEYGRSMALHETLGEDGVTDFELAVHLAELARPIALSHFRGDNRTWSKSDGSPVSTADLVVDEALRIELSRLRPHDGILTEESEEVRAGQSRRWIIDPIDGTHEFVAGRGDWGTNIALEIDGVITLGVVTRPVHRARWWAQRGKGAFLEDGDLKPRRLHVSRRQVLGECRMTAWPETEPTGTTARVRAAGTWVEPDMTCLPKLLAGELEAVFAFLAGPWDFAPGVVLIEEAGGRFQDPFGGRSIFRGAGIFSNGAIDEHVSQLLRGEPTTEETPIPAE